MRRDAEILLKATIKPKRDAFHFHLQGAADASILYFWISLSKERVCIREFKINSEDIRCISSPEDTSLSIPQKYQRVFDLTADFSPSETNRHGRRLRYIFSYSVQLLVAVLMRKCCNLFSPPPPTPILVHLTPRLPTAFGVPRSLVWFVGRNRKAEPPEEGERVGNKVNREIGSGLVRRRLESPPAVPGF